MATEGEREYGRFGSMSSSTGVSRLASLIGQEIDGRYRVDSVLARGGMGVVLRGTHLVLGQPVAIKVMLDATMRDANLRERFLREARILAQVRSPAIASIFDAGLLSDGTPYLVMELLEGEDLESILARGTLPIEQAAKILAQVCEGLAEAHGQGIVHRDLKPANVFVVQKTNGEKVSKIIDFGISKRLGDASEQTGVHTLVGSPYYMAPEQAYASRDIDHRADIWSLGVILYRLVLGAQPFEAATLPAILIRIKSTTPTFPSTLDPAFANVLRKCLEKDRAKRYETALELRDDLVQFVGDGAKSGAARVFPSHRASKSQIAHVPLATTPASGAFADQGVTSEWLVPETVTAEVSAVLLDTGEISSTHLEEEHPGQLEGDRTVPSMTAMPVERDDVPADRKKTVVRLRAPEPKPEPNPPLDVPESDPRPPAIHPKASEPRLDHGQQGFGWQPVWEGEAPRAAAVAVEPERPAPPMGVRLDFQLEKAGPWIVGGAVAVAVVAVIVLAAQCGGSPAPPAPPPRSPPQTGLSAAAPPSPPALIVLSPPPAEIPDAPDASDASAHPR